MKKHEIEILPIASVDLDEIFDHILHDNPTAAEKMLGEILTSLQSLENFPYAGVRILDSSLKHYAFRMITIKPYVAFYKFIDNKIFIYRILHGARDYLRILKDSSSFK